MPDNTLQFETKVNLTGLQTGMGQATQIVQGDAQKMAAAMSILKNETAALGEAYKVFGNMAAGGNQAAVAAIAEHIQATNQAKAAVASLSAVEEEETQVVQRNISTRMAASAELRVLEGNMMGSTRAAGAFLSTLPGIGQAMQVAFPVFGAIALGEVFLQLGSKAKDLYDNFLTLKVEGQDLAKGLVESSEKIARSWGETLSLMHQTGMRDNPVGQLEGDLLDAQQALGVLQQRAQAARQDLQSVLAIRESGNYLGHGTTEEGNENAIAGQRAQLQEINALIERQKALIADRNSEANKAEDKGPKKGKDPQIDQLRELEEGLNKAKLAMDVSAQDEADYWSDSLKLFRDGSAQYETIMGKIISANHRVAEEFGKDVLKRVEDDQRAIDANAKMSEELIATYDKITKQEVASERAQAEFNAEQAKSKEIQAQASQNLEAARISAGEAEGAITKLGESQLLSALHAQVYAEKIAALKAQLDAIAAEHPVDQSGVDSQEKRAQSVQNQLSQVKGQANVAAFTDQQAQAKAFAAPYLTAFNDINNGFLQVTNKMILGTQSISRDFAQMGASLVVSVADSTERMLASWVRFEIQSLLAHQLSNTAKVASTTTAAATTTTISATTALAQVTHEAAVAAASTWAALSGIPVIGPVLGAAAAGAAYAGVLALAAFETGGIIPNTGIAMVHQGEAVLPKGLTNLLLSTASSSTNSSSAAVTNNFNGGSDKMFQRQMMASSATVVKSAQRGLRRMGKS